MSSSSSSSSLAFSARCISSGNPERIGDLIINCQIPNAPDPCFAPPFDIILPPPPPYGFGCICPTATFTGTGVATVTGTFGPKSSDCCDLDLKINVDVPPQEPPPCMAVDEEAISSSVVEYTVDPGSAGAISIDTTISLGSSGDCQISVEPTLELPCLRLDSSNQNTCGGWSCDVVGYPVSYTDYTGGATRVGTIFIGAEITAGSDGCELTIVPHLVLGSSNFVTPNRLTVLVDDGIDDNGCQLVTKKVISFVGTVNDPE